MDISDLVADLNKEQREAVTAPIGHILILAGAGSGKTRVLTHRIAWLLATEQARPHNILAVTFTNKAANEMRSRISALLTQPFRGLWVGTFHSITHYILRIHWQSANLPQTFQILDSDDQRRVCKRILKSLRIDDKAWPLKKVQNFINSQKEQGLRANNTFVDEGDVWLAQMVNIYQVYEETCQRTGAVDFAELLLRTYELFLDNPPLLEQYQQRFQYIHVDEFQDTNTIQYNLLCLLLGSQGKLFFVFDDDQSIYAWRGARIENIQNLKKDFISARLIRLEQNYRSSGKILAVANALIGHNQGRLGKKLWTQDEAGKPVFLYNAYTETDEADFVVEKISEWHGKYQEIAILYRTTAQSRAFEEALLRKNIPYRIYGGLRFYERLEIKDILAYLRLMLHLDDDGAFERIINTPKRGIGERTVAILREIARKQGSSLWRAAQEVIATKQLKARASNSLIGFMDFIEQGKEQIADLPLHEQVEQIKNTSGLLEHYQKAGEEEAQKRQENLEELVNAAQQFAQINPDSESQLTAFLDHAALEAGEKQGNQFGVQLMTLHSAKGLEFKMVFLCGLEEGLLPHQNSIAESKLEEERRLCYVGITRAQQYLYLCHAESRYRYGKRESCKPSRFIEEVPPDLLEEVRMRWVAPLKSSLPILPIGQRVKHQELGEGVVLDCEGKGEFARVQVQFADGNKWLIAAYTTLERL